jgi:hypothetical protein
LLCLAGSWYFSIESVVRLIRQRGKSVAGSHVRSLVLTDIASAWTIAAPMLVREQTLIIMTVEQNRLTQLETGAASVEAPATQTTVDQFVRNLGTALGARRGSRHSPETECGTSVLANSRRSF